MKRQYIRRVWITLLVVILAVGFHAKVASQLSPSSDISKPDILNTAVIKADENWDFEFGLNGWEKTGTAFNSQPTYGDNVFAFRIIGNGTPYSMPIGGDYWRDVAFPIGHKKDYWIGTYENRPNQNIPRGGTQGDEPQGTLTSKPFTVNTNYITFLISGGNDINGLKIELSEEVSPGIYQPVAGTAKTGRNNELFRRDWWDVSSLKGRNVRIQIVDNVSGGWGHINVDDIRFQDTEPPYGPPSPGANTPTVNAFKDGDVWRDLDTPIWGFTDMHTHPMSYLGFGKKLIHGATDVGAIIPVGTRDCNRTDKRATSIQEALGDDNSTQGGYGLFDNRCGDEIRKRVILELESSKGAHSEHGSKSLGYSSDPSKAFVQWPRFNDITHQQMWVDWIHRAYQGGLRVMVALAVNNKTLADGVQGDEPKKDQQSADLQISEIKDFVSNCARGGIAIARNCDFMEIATTPEQLRSIVRRNKLAVVIGVEIDNVGNFNQASSLTQEMIANEVQRLQASGVRYIFPIHVIDNQFGGTAVYESIFNYSNKREYGKFWDLTCADPGEGISNVIRSDIVTQLAQLLLGGDPLSSPPIPSCPSGIGHKNRKSLTSLGEFAIREMMKQGMLIDIDHMSQNAANRTLEIAESVPGGYPINAGHNGFRSNGQANENGRTDSQLTKILNLGGVMGVGWGDNVSCGFLNNYRFGLSRMGGRQLAIGTDINGLVKAPKPRFGSDSDASGNCSPSRVSYSGSTALTIAQTGSRKWDYNTEGVAHYGLFPDFLQDLKNIGMTSEERTTFFFSAEHFAQMWEKSLRASALLP